MPSTSKRAVETPIQQQEADSNSEDDRDTAEWRKVEKRPIPYNRFLKLYPLAEADAQLFDSVPAVVASIMRLARNTTLPLEDAVFFKDHLDRLV